MPGARATRWVVAAVAVALLAVQIFFSARSLEAAYFTARGDASRRAGDAAGARADYHRANAAVPFDANRLRSEASAARDSLGPAQAVPLYAESLRRGPYVPLTLVAAAVNYIELGRFGEADAVLDTAVRLIGADWRVRLMRGTILIGREEYAEAERELLVAAEVAAPPQARVYYELSRALHGQKEYDGALAAVGRALGMQPLLPEYHLARAKALMALDRAPESCENLAWTVRTYRAQVERGEDSLAALFEAEDLYALALLADGRFDEAEAAFADLYIRCTAPQIELLAIHLHQIAGEMYDPFPDSSLWAFALDLLVQTGRAAEYEKTLASASMLYPEAEMGLLVAPRARALTAAGDPEAAIALLAAAPAGVAGSAPYRLALGEAHAAAGRPAEARTEYAIVLGLKDLSPVIRKQAQAGLAAIPAQ